MQREVCAAPDYKAMYFELFRASVQAAQLLQDAQKRAEQHLLEADPLAYARQPFPFLSPSGDIFPRRGGSLSLGGSRWQNRKLYRTAKASLIEKDFPRPGEDVV